ncbi:ArnT family glycosyltransferase [Dokdonella koreensis]|uniref:PMT family glycosyltransferase, 4-amino-4-deoxy-L-arabinose transferase n=1 Tax=Dokdonella koreensis DS-123 TaxID=1300342 RepID=A0A167H3M3_9GAMM|nr:glycosyltransferase family 39 protein [Dokdonella koreensis]ANB18752.1 PMT family glycosyltransferase, 4-amino-4-deoxy-L-arabinose transferase [Dokdonella koreensis DS-123]
MTVIARTPPQDLRWRWLLLVVLAASSLGAGLGLREPSPPDEPRFVLAARHMVESGDWLVPQRGREFYAEKPPVFMWLQAAAYTLTGNWRVAFLLPSWLAALATLGLTWDLARRLWNRRVALHAAAALWVCLQFGLQARRGQIDMVLVAMTTLALWGLLRHLLRGPAPRALWLGAFAAGVGTVTKGVGFLPLLVVLPWLFARRTGAPPADVRPFATWAGAGLAFLAGTALWLGPLLAALAAGDDPALRAYAQELVFKQTAARYAHAWHHVQPAWYYLQVIATLWLPGALLLPWLLPAWWRRLRRGDRRQILLLGWSALVLVFFSASPGKREVYLFPALPALCLAAAPLLPALLRRRGVQRLLGAYLLVAALVATHLAAGGLSGLHSWAQGLAAQRGIASDALRRFLLGLLALGLAGLALAAWSRLRRGGTALAVFTAVLWTTYGLALAPALDATASTRGLMARVGTRIGPAAELGMVAWREQNLLQADRPVTEFGFKQPWHLQWQEAAAWGAAAPRDRWLFVLDEALSPCVARAEALPIGTSNRRNWLLVPATAIRSGCVTPPFVEESEPADGD